MLMSSDKREAGLVYGPNAFKVMRPGHYVTCAVTGEAIDLEALRYWCAERQEPYASAQIATQRLNGDA